MYLYGIMAEVSCGKMNNQAFTAAFRIGKIRSLNEMKKLAAGLKGWQRGEGMTAVVFAPAPYLALLAEELRYEPFLIGAQDVSFPLGCGGYKTSDLNCSCAPTGELCPDDLTTLGCRAVLLGSMDRRIVLGETPEVIACKAAFCAVHGLRPYICIGELSSEHGRHMCGDVLAAQLDPVIRMLRENDDVCVRDLSLIYEPWVDTPGQAPALNEIEEALSFIHAYFSDRIEYVPEILYGGDLGANRFRDLITMKGTRGLLLDLDE